MKSARNQEKIAAGIIRIHLKACAVGGRVTGEAGGSQPPTWVDHMGYDRSSLPNSYLDRRNRGNVTA